MPTPGYLITLYENSAYLGGVLITNDHGFPIEFKHTDSVSPTKVQHMLYGPVLEQYIRNHVIVGALMAKIETQPTFFVVPQHQLYDMADATELTLISLQRTQLAAIGDKGTVNRSKESECLLQGWTDQHPVRILFGAMPVETQEAILKDLVYLSKHMDLVEPLERLENVVIYLCSEKNQD
ncbi:MAG: hypothetical protein QNK37_12300 [Acidobacteriota bacterium]|nr:hypothetical protein [Acidobacteriota bacterium]